jgi:hypothetical protein
MGMNRLKGMAAAAAIACAAAFAAFLLPHGGDAGMQQDIAVFQPERVTRLSQDNLVDALVAQTFTEPIKRTDLKGTVLAVDFAIRAETGTSVNIVNDLKKLVRLSFYQASNVDRLLVRYVEAKQDAVHGGGSDGYKLLLAADVRRTDKWLSGSSEEIAAADPLRDPVWRQRLRLSITGEWLDRFGPFTESYDG